MTEREHGRGEGREPLDEEAAWAQIVAGFHREAGSPTDRAEELSSRREDESATRPEPWSSAAVEDDGSQTADRGPGPGSDTTDQSTTDQSAGDPGAGEERQDLDDVSAGSLLEKRPENPTGARQEDDPQEDDRPGGEDRKPGEQDGENGAADKPPAGAGEVRTFTVYAAGTGPRDWKPANAGEEEDHFVPPEPPPLPSLDNTAKLAWIAVLGGPALLFSAVILQIPVNWWLITFGVGGFLGGFGTLVYRMNDEDDFDDPGRGAVV